MPNSHIAALRLYGRYFAYTSPLIVALIVYGYSLRMPFFLDDAAHFQILSQTGGLEFWGNFPTFPFYRPAVFTLWKGYTVIFGAYDPVALHYINLICFGVGGVLVGQIIRRVLPSDVRLPAAVFGGILFVLFPFGYQAVVMVAALFHLTLLLGVTAVLWLTLLWLDERIMPAMLPVIWGCATLAIFSHESGVLLLPLLVTLVWAIYGWQKLLSRRFMWVAVPTAGLVALYLMLWVQFRPQGGTGLSTEIDVSLAVLLQAAVYPFAALFRPLIDGDADSTLVLLLVVGVGVSLSIVLVIMRRELWRVWVFGGIWLVGGVLPAALFLSAAYVLGQPRLALFGFVGAAMLWGVFLGVITARGTWVLRVIAVALFAGFVYISLEFLTMRRHEFLSLAHYQTELMDIIATHDINVQGGVIINAPDFIAPLEENRRFLIGTEGVLFVDPAADYTAQLAVNSDDPFTDLNIIAYSNIQRVTGLNFAVHPPDVSAEGVIEAVRDAPYVIVTQFDEDVFAPRLVGGTLVESDSSTVIEIDFAAGDFELNSAGALLQDDWLQVMMDWQVNVPEAVKVFVHVYCDDEFLTQSDGYPWGDTFPFAAWEAGTTYTDIRYIALNDYVWQPDCLRVVVGLYYEADVSRLSAYDVLNDVRLTNDQVLIPTRLADVSDGNR